MPCRSLPLAQGTSLYLSNTVLTVERIENRDTKATGIKPFENIPVGRLWLPLTLFLSPLNAFLMLLITNKGTKDRIQQSHPTGSLSDGAP